MIARVGIGKVYIGRYDQNSKIHRLGWKALSSSGISLFDFPLKKREIINEINRQFSDYFTSKEGPSNDAQFDYQLNDGRFEIKFSRLDSRSIQTKWDHRDDRSIYACALSPIKVALARYAKNFTEIDDPTAFDFSPYAPVHEGEIVVFSGPTGSVLVRVVKVQGAHNQGAAPRFVKIKFEIRPHVP